MCSVSIGQVGYSFFSDIPVFVRMLCASLLQLSSARVTESNAQAESQFRNSTELSIAVLCYNFPL